LDEECVIKVNPESLKSAGGLYLVVLRVALILMS